MPQLVYSGVESRPIAGGGGAKTFLFCFVFYLFFLILHTKWAQNGVILVGLGLGPVGVGSNSPNFNLKGPLIGGSTPSQNKSWLQAWWKGKTATCHFNRSHF